MTFELRPPLLARRGWRPRSRSSPRSPPPRQASRCEVDLRVGPLLARHRGPRVPDGQGGAGQRPQARRQHRHVGIRLWDSEGALSGEVADDGVGFDVGRALDRRAMRLHMGLDTMRERLALVGGSLDIASAPGSGSRHRLHDPVGRLTPRATRPRYHPAAMSEIISVHGRQILDSRGNPTVEVEVILDSGATGRAAVPSGASTGALRGGRAARRRPARATAARASSRRSRTSTSPSPARCTGMDALDQRGDRRRDDRARRHRRTSATWARTRSSASRWRWPSAAADESRAAALPLRRRRRRPRAAGADDERHQRRRPRRQQRSTCRSSWSSRWAPRSFAEALRIGAETFHALKALLHERGLVDRRRRRGRVRARPGVERGGDHARSSRPPTAPATATTVAIALDAASTEFYADGRYHAGRRGPRRCRPPRWSDYLADLCDRYPIVSIEDGLAEDDWDGWQLLTERLGGTRAAGRRRPVRDQRRAAAARHRRRRGQRDPGQGEPDRHAVRDARRRPAGAPRRATRR